jgi:metallophosphoesterase superfamily enzyme
MAFWARSPLALAPGLAVVQTLLRVRQEMKYAILGDIHANITALEAVLERIDREDVDQILSVGDVVGYGPSPRECIRLLRERCAEVVRGNHDAACSGMLDDRYFNYYARGCSVDPHSAE